MDVVYTMDETMLFDAFFNYLREINVFFFWNILIPKAKKERMSPSLLKIKSVKNFQSQHLYIPAL